MPAPIKQIQYVIITLKTGQKLVFSGPPQATADMVNQRIGILDIQFTEPKDLEEGYHFEKVKVKD